MSKKEMKHRKVYKAEITTDGCLSILEFDVEIALSYGLHRFSRSRHGAVDRLKMRVMEEFSGKMLCIESQRQAQGA